MATYTWTLQGTSPTTIDSSDIIQFAGAVFGSAIFVDDYQDSTHVKSSGGANDSFGNSPHNSKYISDTNVSIDGGSSGLVESVTTANCPLKINFSHGSSVAISAHYLYAYDGSDTENAPTEVTFKVCEQGTTPWVEAGGSAAALAVADRTTATSHNFYFMISASPTTVGLKSAFTIRDELIYT